MRKLLLLQIFAILCIAAYGQITPVDLKEMKSIATSPTYDQLFQRFLQNDTALTLTDYRTLYFGQAYRDDYRPYSRHDSIRALNTYLNTVENPDFNKVLTYTRLILKEFPFNLEQVFLTGIAYDKLNKKDQARIWLKKYENLLTAIISTGDGRSAQTAFMVTKTSDEYNVIRAFRLKFTGQSLIMENNHNYDKMDLEENEHGIEALYFNVDLFYGKL